MDRTDLTLTGWRREHTAVRSIDEWLALLGLSEYAQRFAENCIDISIVGDLTDEDLIGLGIPLGHRKKMLRAIAQVNATAPNAPLAATQSVPQVSAGRRQLTVMFCDLVGSTALAAQLDPEDMRSVIRTYQTVCSRTISAYDGLISRFVGDGILAFFGFPRAHEDDAERAVRAGLDLIGAVSRIDMPNREPLNARVGIATGLVVVGDLIEESTLEEKAVFGETPNLASRLQSLAEPGTLVICPSTRRLVAGYFDYRALGPVALKGISEPVEAWQVIGVSQVESRFEAKHGTGVPPLLGREEEIELLLRRWQQAAHEEGRVVLLTGEPGIGKSHITLTLEERLQAEPHIRLRYFCSAHHINSALFPFINQLERAARFQRNDTPAQKLAKLEALLAPTADLERAVTYFAHLLSLPPTDRYRIPDVSPQKRKENTLAALLAQLEALAALRPVLVIFEDVHWIDPTSLELLALTVQRVAQMRVLLLITARPEFKAPWPDHAHITNISLTRLSRRHGTALIHQVTVGKTLPEDLLLQILGQTDGVPLFIEELTKAVLESGLLQERNGHYVLERPLPALAIPTTLHASLMARLDRLAPVREVAQIGAVAGRDFSYELLSVVAGLPKEKLDEALSQLVHSELVFCKGEIPQAHYTFKHVLVRDAAYDGLLRSRRAQLHAAIADALEHRFTEITEAEPETLAHHLTEAGLSEKAVGYWLRAGKRAAARSANLEAIAHLRRGLEVLSHLPAHSSRDRLELDLQVAMGPCLISTAGPASSPAVASFARARELCDRMGDPPEYLQVMFWLASASAIRGELPQAEEQVAALRNRAETRGDRPALLNAIRGRAMILFFMGRVIEAHEDIERAIEMFGASDEAERLAARAAGQDAGAAALALMSWILWTLGYLDKAFVRMGSALQRAVAVHHPHTQAYVYYYASVFHALRGEPAIAHHHAERCLSLSEEHGFRQWRGLSRAMRGITKTMLDPTSSSSLDEVRGALDDYRGAGYQFGVTALDILLCPALLAQHQHEAALEVIEQGLLAVDHSERVFEAELYRLKARALRFCGMPNADIDVQSLLGRALTAARAGCARSLELRAAEDLASLWMDQGRRDEAFNLLAPLYQWFSEGTESQELMVARDLLHRLQHENKTSSRSQ